jgi:DNA-directed RNA polymerase specialized sigma24 family protein
LTDSQTSTAASAAVSSPLAEGVVQDVFVCFFEHADRFDETRPFGPLFMRSVVNTALNTNQREKREIAFRRRTLPNWKLS